MYKSDRNALPPRAACWRTRAQRHRNDEDSGNRHQAIDNRVPDRRNDQIVAQNIAPVVEADPLPLGNDAAIVEGVEEQQDDWDEQERDEENCIRQKEQIRRK